MIRKCKLCGAKVLAFLWSTSRNIDQERLREVTQEAPQYDAYPICWACIEEHHLIVRTNVVRTEKEEQ